MFEGKSSNILENIKRNDHVHFFYKKFDTHGFGCAYLFRKFFVKHDMLSVLDLHGLKDCESIDCKSKSYVFLCDVDITPSIIFKLCIKAEKVFIIDTKSSTVKNLIPLYEGQKLMKHTNLNFICNEKLSPIALIWKLLADTQTPPAFVEDLHNSYMNEIGVLDQNNSAIVRSIHNNFTEWDDVTEEEWYRSQKASALFDCASIVKAKNISQRNSKAILIGKYPCLIINVNRENMDEVGVMAISVAKIAITYEITDSGYYYRIYSNSDDVNLLLLFKNQNCFGNEHRVWFVTNEFIFTRSKSFLQRLKELFFHEST